MTERGTGDRSALRAVTIDDIARQRMGAKSYLERRLTLRIEAELLALAVWADSKRLLAAIDAGDLGGVLSPGMVASTRVQLEELAEARPVTPELSRLYALLQDGSE